MIYVINFIGMQPIFYITYSTYVSIIVYAVTFLKKITHYVYALLIYIV